MTVDVGFVEGTSPATIPTGTPMSTVRFSLSSARMPWVFSSLMASYRVSAAKRFLISLSAGMPKPVSSTAISANLRACSAAAQEMAAVILSRSAWLMRSSTRWACRACRMRPRTS